MTACSWLVPEIHLKLHMNNPSSLAKRISDELQARSLHKVVANELANNFVSAALWWEPGDPSLYDIAMGMLSRRWEHPEAGAGPRWHTYLPRPGIWHDLAQAMVNSINNG